jgi:hypothetical protein
MPSLGMTIFPSVQILLPVLVALTIILSPINALTCRDALLQSGYPTCFDNCAGICANYCPGPANQTCLCTTPTYGTAILNCVRKSCSASDYKFAESLSIIGCSEVGINVAPALSAIDASVAATATGIATSFATGYTAGSGASATATSRPLASTDDKTPSLSTSDVVKIVIGALSGVSVILFAAWMVWTIVKRRRHANPNQNHGPVTIVAEPYQPPPYEAAKSEPVVQWVPQPGSDVYPTAVTQTSSDVYPTVVGNGQPQYAQVPIQQQQVLVPYQQVPLPPQPVSPLQQHVQPFNQHPAAELPNIYHVTELPHPAAQQHVELPAGFNKS